MTVIGVPARALRAIAVGVVVLDLFGLVGLSLHRTTTTTTTIHPLAQAVPAPPSDSREVGPPTIAGPPSGPVAIPVAARHSTGTAPARHQTKPKAKHHHTPTEPKAPPGGIPPVTKTAIGKCPVKLAKPAQMGGVQTFVPFAPAFGPFSAEAFAAASAYQPELELLGPILAQYPTFAPKVEPLLKPVLALFGTGSNGLFKLISPLYSPHRTQVLTAETKLATFFAPYSKQLAGQPLSGCIVDLEAALVGDTKHSTSKQHNANSDHKVDSD